MSESNSLPPPNEFMARAFGEGGYLAQRFEGYRPRSGQVALASAVDDAIAAGDHLMAEAPTGCHVAGQGILMFDGSVKLVEDVVVGDQLMGLGVMGFAEPRTVLALARGREETVDVVPEIGKVWRVNRGHILTLVHKLSQLWFIEDWPIHDLLRQGLIDPSSSRPDLSYVRIRQEVLRDGDWRKDPILCGFDLRPTGIVEDYFGFSLDGDGRYLLDDFTVTHNTGKSLAYLVPATYRAAREHAQLVDEYGPEPPQDVLAPTRVIVVTANIALQEQLARKDLPMLSEILPWKFTYGLLKGRSNFLCNERLYAFREQGLDFSPMPDELDQIEDIRAWAKDCAEGRMRGDMSELPFEPTHRIWRNFSVSNDECTGQDCPFYDKCYARKEQTHARNSNVIVTNYHMLLAHLQVRSMTNQDLVLPPASVVILDEVHRFADIARDVLGFRITKEMVTRTVRKLRRDADEEDSRAAQDVFNAANHFYEALYAFKMSGKYKTRIKTSVVESDGSVAHTWGRLDEAMQRGKSRLEKRIERMNYQIQSGFGDEREMRGQYGQMLRAKERMAELHKQIDQAIHMRGGEENVYFIEVDEKNRVFLSAKPIHVGGWLSSQLFGRTSSVISTSATMCVGGKFDYLSREIGCEHFGQCHAESPFSWSDQALLITPSHMPEPNDIAFADAVSEATVEVARLAEGRTLGLFTSRKMLDRVHAYVKAAKLPYRLLKQGEAPRVKLIEEFKRDVSSILLGTESFWAGVDVPGESLSAVVIDRLPFPSPEDPIADAIAERDPKWFRNYSTPRACLQLKQGVGRLIRSVDDVGIVVVLDRRIIDKPYGKIFTRSLPGMSRSNYIEDIGAFLHRKRRKDMTEEERLEDAFS